MKIDYTFDGETLRLDQETTESFQTDLKCQDEIMADAQVFADTKGNEVQVMSSGGTILVRVEPVKVPS